MKPDSRIDRVLSPQCDPHSRQAMRLRSQKGASLVELAVTLPLLLLLVLGAIDFGQAYYLSIEVANAARAGVQYGAARGNVNDISGMQNAAIADAADVPGLVADPTWGCECSDGSGPVADCASPPTCGGAAGTGVYYVQVRTSVTYRPVIPWPGVPSLIPLTGQARMRVEE